MKIENILATKGAKVLTVHSSQTVKEVVTLLARHRIGALVVVDDAGRLVGIVSERDVIREAAQHDDILARPVGAVMTQSVVTGSPRDDVRSVLQTMTERRFRHLPILDRGELIGVISIGDMVKAQLDEDEGEIETLQTQITKG